MATVTLPESPAPERLLNRLSSTAKDRLLVALLTDLSADLKDEPVISIIDEADGRVVGTFLPKRTDGMSYEIVGKKIKTTNDEEDLREASRRRLDGRPILNHEQFIEAFRAAIIAEPV